ncbi:MAG: hypothetical protein OER91_09570 [Gammaproteobacteria bacterium]|nr:hypothetical protein [Gammaproteobacteria bacterium]
MDKLLQEAENSVDVWTAPGRDELGFREVAHYFVFSRYLEAGHNGTEISIKDVIDAKIPSDI